MRRKDFTKQQLLDAMDKTKSIKAAARYLNCSYQHLKKWMKQYKDEETGKTFFELHKNQSGKGVPKFFRNGGNFKQDINIKGVLNGDIDPSSYDPRKLKHIMIESGHIAEECSFCKFHERRELDNKIPLLLHFKNGNSNYWANGNVSLVCYNCYFLYIGKVFNESDFDYLEGHQTKSKKSEHADLQLDEYQLKRLKEIGMDFGGEKEDDDPYDLVSYKD